MQEEKLLLTRRDRDRLKVFHEVRKGHLTQREAAGQLNLTERWIREMVSRVRDQGDRAVVHGLCGKASHQKIAEKVERRAVGIMIYEECQDGGQIDAVKMHSPARRFAEAHELQSLTRRVFWR